jgi:hypothetical protein
MCEEHSLGAMIGLTERRELIQFNRVSQLNSMALANSCR